MMKNEVDLQKIIESYTRLTESATKSRNLKTMITVFQNTERGEISISLYNCLFSSGTIESLDEEIFSTTDKTSFNERILPVLIELYSQNNEIRSQDIRKAPFYEGSNYAAVGTRANLQFENFSTEELNRIVEEVKKSENFKETDKFSLALEYANLSLSRKDIEEEREVYEQVNGIITRTNGTYSKMRTEKKLEYLTKMLVENPDNKVLGRMVNSIVSGNPDPIISNSIKLANFKLKNSDFLNDDRNAKLIEVAKDAIREGYLSMPDAKEPEVITTEKGQGIDFSKVNKLNYWDKKKKDYINDRLFEKAAIAEEFEKRVSKLNSVKDEQFYKNIMEGAVMPVEVDSEIKDENTMSYGTKDYGELRLAYRNIIDPEGNMSREEFKTLLANKRAETATKYNIEGAPEETLDRIIFSEGIKQQKEVAMEIKVEPTQVIAPKAESLEELLRKTIESLEKTSEEFNAIRPELNGAIEALKSLSKIMEQVKTAAPEVITEKKVEPNTIATPTVATAEKRVVEPNLGVTPALEGAVEQIEGRKYKDFIERADARVEALKQKQNPTVQPDNTDIKGEYQKLITRIFNNPRMIMPRERFGTSVIEAINLLALGPKSIGITADDAQKIVDISRMRQKEYEEEALAIVSGKEETKPQQVGKIELPDMVTKMGVSPQLVSYQENYEEALSKLALTRCLVKNGIIAKDQYSDEIVKEYVKAAIKTLDNLKAVTTKYIKENDLAAPQQAKVQMKNSDVLARQKVLNTINSHFMSDIRGRTIKIEARPVEDGTAAKREIRIEIKIGNDVIVDSTSRFEDETVLDEQLLPRIANQFGLSYNVGANPKYAEKQDKLGTFEYSVESPAGDILKLDGFTPKKIVKFHDEVVSGAQQRVDAIKAQQKNNNGNNPAQPNQAGNKPQTPPVTPPQPVPPAKNNSNSSKGIQTVNTPANTNRLKAALRNPAVKKTLNVLKYVPLVLLAGSQPFGWAAIGGAIALAGYDTGKYRENHPRKGRTIVRVDESKQDVWSKIKRVSGRLKRGIGEASVKGGIVVVGTMATALGAGAVVGAVAGVYGIVFGIRKIKEHRQLKKIKEEEQKLLEAEANKRLQQQNQQQAALPQATPQPQYQPVNPTPPQPVVQPKPINTGRTPIINDKVELNPGVIVNNSKGVEVTIPDGTTKYISGELYETGSDKLWIRAADSIDTDIDALRTNLINAGATLMAYAINYRNSANENYYGGMVLPQDVRLANTMTNTNTDGKGAK